MTDLFVAGGSDPNPGDGEATTLGGFLAERLGRIPLPGDEVEVGEWVFQVVEADGHHVLQVAAARKS